MSEAAVIDKPVTDTTETKGDAPDATTLLNAEDAGGKLQTEPDADTGNETPPDKPADHLAEIERERQDAEARVLEEKAAELSAANDRKREADRIENARKEKVKAAIPSALERMGKLTEALSKLDIRDENDASKPLSARELKAFSNIIEGLGLDVEEAVSEKVNASYDAAFLESLGQDSISDFWDAAKEHADQDGTIPVSALLDLHAERKALSTKAVKGMTLEQAAKASATVARELATLKKAEFLRGKDDPSPSGEPAGNDGHAVAGHSSLEEATALHVAGQITNQEMREAKRRYGVG